VWRGQRRSPRSDRDTRDIGRGRHRRQRGEEPALGTRRLDRICGDLLDFRSQAAPDWVDLEKHAARVGGTSLILDGFERILRGSGDDEILGSSRDEVLEGSAGADDLRGTGGSDRLYGGRASITSMAEPGTTTSMVGKAPTPASTGRVTRSASCESDSLTCWRGGYSGSPRSRRYLSISAAISSPLATSPDAS
jgi:hypothetical protein